jgi:hypothetical protein
MEGAMTNLSEVEARLCPTCKKPPTDSKEGKEVTLECKPHGFMAIGYSRAQAARHWNRFIGFITRDAVERAAEDPGSLTSSVCTFCKRNTESITHDKDGKYWVECGLCHLTKYEREVAHA